MRLSDRRLRDWTDKTDFGTDTLQTSGNVWLTGTSQQVQDYTLHSYQCVPISGTEGLAGPWTGQFKIGVSNDDINYTCIYTQDIIGDGPIGKDEVSTGTLGVAYSDTWTFAYARPYITGTAGYFLISERHLS
jgi:hypothetical protein